MIRLKKLLIEEITKTLRVGSRGDQVTELQQKLISLKYLDEKLPSGKPADDGIFGPTTKAAVIKFQQKEFPGQTSEHDGIVGPDTREKLSNVKSNSSSSDTQSTEDLINIMQKSHRPYPYNILDSGKAQPEFIAARLQKARDAWNTPEAEVEACVRAIKNMDMYNKISAVLGTDVESYILQMMDEDELSAIYDNSPNSIRNMIDNLKSHETAQTWKDIKQTDKTITFAKNWETLLNATKSVKLCDAPQFVDQCARFVNAVDPTIGRVGNAWDAYITEHPGKNPTYSVMESGLTDENKKLYDKYFNLNLPDSIKTGDKTKPAQQQLGNIKSLHQKIIDTATPPDTSLLTPGSYVGMYWPPSSYHQNAFVDSSKKQKYSPFNTHIGLVIGIKDGVPIILHEVGGIGYAEPYNKLQKGSKIAWIKTADPNFSTSWKSQADNWLQNFQKGDNDAAKLGKLAKDIVNISY